MAATAPRNNNARRQSFVQYVRSSVVALQKSAIAAQTARDDTKANAWGRLIHCCTAMGYAIAICGVDMVAVMLLSTWDWVRRDDKNRTVGVSNDALAFLIGGVMASAYALVTYCNIAQSTPPSGTERHDQPNGPRYARWVLVVGAAMVPAAYGWLWALEHGAGINAWYSLAHPPTMLVWVIVFLIMDLGGRVKWAARDRRKGQAGGAGASSDGLQNDGSNADAHNNTANSPGAASAAQSSSFIADTLVSLIGFLAGISVATLCKYAVPAQQILPQLFAT